MKERGMISGTTKYYAIIGNPIGQALSPIIHNAAFAAQQIDAVFLGCEVQKGGVKDAIAGGRALGFSGFVVTMPYKREVNAYLDELDDRARILDATNTIERRGDRLIGHNTDGDGFVAYIKSEGISLIGRDVFLFGAGGAARSIALSLMQERISTLYLCNAFADEAYDAMRMLAGAGFDNCEYVPFEDNAVKNAAVRSKLIVNATSLGMANRPSPHADLLPWESLEKDVPVADIVHKPRETPLLAKARSAGHKTLTGDGMLLYQGLIAYRLLTGREAPADVMERALAQWLSDTERG